MVFCIIRKQDAIKDGRKRLAEVGKGIFAGL